MNSKTSVLLANDFPLVRNSIRELLDHTPNLQVVACAEGKSDVLTLADAHRPQVSLLDLDVEWPVLTDLVKNLSSREIPVLVMTGALEDEKTFQLLRAGANGIISRKIDPALLCRSVRAVGCGEIWMSRGATSQLIEKIRMQSAKLGAMAGAQEVPSASKAEADSAVPATNNFGLTPRELEIVRAIGEAMSNRDIAVHYGISEYTVKHHLTRIFDKIGVYSRLELAMMATHHGLVSTQVSAVA